VCSGDAAHFACADGAGKYPGGDGIVREVRFLRPLAVGKLGERGWLDALRGYSTCDHLQTNM